MIAHRHRSGLAEFAFSDRWGGASAAPFDELNLARHVGDEPARVEQNRALVAAELAPPGGGVTYMNQVHGTAVATVDTPGEWPSQPPAVDAMVTTRPGVVLAVLVADCVPVVLADPESGVAGVAHAGRAGMVAGVIPAVVEAMRAAGGRELVAQLGPAICGACYEVPASMRAEVAATVPAAWATTRWGTPGLDVSAGVRAQLDELGVQIAPLTSETPCTAEDAAYFSYRRDQTTGRFAGFAWLHR